MKYFLLIACLTLTIVSNAGGDTKAFKQVANAIAKNDLKKAAEALEKVSATAQTSLQYLQSAALIYDSLKDYSKAITYYTKLPKEAADPVAVAARIVYLKEELSAYEGAERIRMEKQKTVPNAAAPVFYNNRLHVRFAMDNELLPSNVRAARVHQG